MPLNNLKEAIDDESPGEATLEHGQSSASLVYRFKWADIETTLPQILGYSQTVGGVLSRTIPAAHPMFPWMYATRITSFKPYQFDFADSPADPTDIPGGGQGLAVWAQAQYNFVRITVQFEPKTYQVYTDTALPGGDEYNRYVTKTSNPRGEALTMDKGTFIYTGTSTGGTNYGGSTTPACSGVSKRIVKTELSWKWEMLPEVGAFTSSSVLLSPNQDNLLGTLNTDAFEGYPAGTLLLNSTRKTAHNFGVQPSLGVEQAARYYDFEFLVTYYEPGASVSVAGTGHNWLPAPDGSFCLVKSSSGVGNPLYASSDWTKLFKVN